MTELISNVEKEIRYQMCSKTNEYVTQEEILPHTHVALFDYEKVTILSLKTTITLAYF